MLIRGLLIVAAVTFSSPAGANPDIELGDIVQAMLGRTGMVVELFANTNPLDPHARATVVFTTNSNKTYQSNSGLGTISRGDFYARGATVALRFWDLGDIITGDVTRENGVGLFVLRSQHQGSYLSSHVLQEAEFLARLELGFSASKDMEKLNARVQEILADRMSLVDGMNEIVQGNLSNKADHLAGYRNKIQARIDYYNLLRKIRMVEVEYERVSLAIKADTPAARSGNGQLVELKSRQSQLVRMLEPLYEERALGQLKPMYDRKSAFADAKARACKRGM